MKTRAAADEPRRPTLTLDDDSIPKLTIGDDDDGDALVPAATPRLVSAYAAELAFEVSNRLTYVGLLFHPVAYQSAGMQYCAVVAPSKGFADRVERFAGHFSG